MHFARLPSIHIAICTIFAFGIAFCNVFVYLGVERSFKRLIQGANMPKAELGSATQLIAVTPSDTTNLSFAGRFLYVGTAGNLNIQAQDDTYSVNIPNVPAGTVLAISPRKVSNTGTTASNIVLFL